MPTGLDITVRDDGPTKTIIVQDKDGNVLGELVIDWVPIGFRVNAYNGDETPCGTLVIRS